MVAITSEKSKEQVKKTGINSKHAYTILNAAYLHT